MKKCPKCGLQNTDDSNFCVRCGCGLSQNRYIHSYNRQSNTKKSDEYNSVKNSLSIYYELKPYENNVSILLDRHLNADKVDDKIKSIKALISHLEEFRLYCYKKGPLYIEYFSEMYEHCHNSKCADFSLLSNYQSRLKELLDNYDDLKLREKLIETLPADLMQFLKNNNNIIQKDIYRNFNAVIKNDIQHLLYQWEKSGVIRREKVGNSYKITISETHPE